MLMLMVVGLGVAVLLTMLVVVVVEVVQRRLLQQTGLYTLIISNPVFVRSFYFFLQ